MKHTKQILKYTAFLGGLFVGAHYASIGIVRVETFAANQFSVAKAAAVELTADKLGLERKKIIDSFTAEQLAEREALRAQLNPALVRAVMRIESTNERYATSPVGAIGLLQIMPANSKRCGVEHWSKLYDPETNVKCGVQILKEELATYHGDVFHALVSYNGGPQAVKGAYPGAVKYAQNVLNIAARDIR